MVCAAVADGFLLDPAADVVNYVLASPWTWNWGATRWPAEVSGSQPGHSSGGDRGQTPQCVQTRAARGEPGADDLGVAVLDDVEQAPAGSVDQPGTKRTECAATGSLSAGPSLPWRATTSSRRSGSSPRSWPCTSVVGREFERARTGTRLTPGVLRGGLHGHFDLAVDFVGGRPASGGRAGQHADFSTAPCDRTEAPPRSEFACQPRVSRGFSYSRRAACSPGSEPCSTLHNE